MTRSAKTLIQTFGIVVQSILILAVNEEKKNLKKGSILFLTLSSTDFAELKHE